MHSLNTFHHITTNRATVLIGGGARVGNFDRDILHVPVALMGRFWAQIKPTHFI